MMARYGWAYDGPGRAGPDRDNRGYRGDGYPGGYGYGARDDGYGGGYGYGARDDGYAGGYGYGPRDGGYGGGAYRYGADYGPTYHRDYKTRAQTDYGDPYDDRGRRVPFRVTRGEFHARDRGPAEMRGYDRGFRGGAGNRYDRGGW